MFQNPPEVNHLEEKPEKWMKLFQDGSILVEVVPPEFGVEGNKDVWKHENWC